MDRIKLGQEVIVKCEVIEEILKKDEKGNSVIYYKVENNKGQGLFTILTLPLEEITPVYDE
jgi:hypothetical protein